MLRARQAYNVVGMGNIQHDGLPTPQSKIMPPVRYSSPTRAIASSTAWLSTCAFTDIDGDGAPLAVENRTGLLLHANIALGTYAKWVDVVDVRNFTVVGAGASTGMAMQRLASRRY